MDPQSKVVTDLPDHAQGWDRGAEELEDFRDAYSQRWIKEANDLWPVQTLGAKPHHVNVEATKEKHPHAPVAWGPHGNLRCRRAGAAHNRAMNRLRRFSAVLACIALLVNGASIFAGTAEAAPAPPPAAVDTTAHLASPCAHCADCDGVPCPQSADCTAPCSVGAPALAAESVEPLRVAVTASVSSPDLAVLVGERPPPDPFPPRA